jgi:methionyl-tRNA formyltransferase
MQYKVVLFGNKATTGYMLEYLHHDVMKVDLVVTVDSALQQEISGYEQMDVKAKNLGIATKIVKDYSLKDQDCRDFFNFHQFDIGISIGWQRIIPEYVLRRFRYGVFGFHGSAGYLPYGRGRSPLNWSLIKGSPRFLNHLFQYSKHPDAGVIHSIKAFEINEYDTIQTLQYKTLLVGKEQLASLLYDYRNHHITLKKQSSNLSSWYPKRSPEDGKIDLHLSTKEIYNLIRGVTHPFPGAFLLSEGGQRLVIWEAYPFDRIIDTSSYKVGEILEVFEEGAILATMDGTLFIKKFECSDPVQKGKVFH